MSELVNVALGMQMRICDPEQPIKTIGIGIFKC